MPDREMLKFAAGAPLRELWPRPPGPVAREHAGGARGGADGEAACGPRGGCCSAARRRWGAARPRGCPAPAPPSRMPSTSRPGGGMQKPAAAQRPRRGSGRLGPEGVGLRPSSPDPQLRRSWSPRIGAHPGHSSPPLSPYSSLM